MSPLRPRRAAFQPQVRTEQASQRQSACPNVPDGTGSQRSPLEDYYVQGHHDDFDENDELAMLARWGRVAQATRADTGSRTRMESLRHRTGRQIGPQLHPIVQRGTGHHNDVENGVDEAIINSDSHAGNGDRNDKSIPDRPQRMHIVVRHEHLRQSLEELNQSTALLRDTTRMLENAIASFGGESDATPGLFGRWTWREGLREVFEVLMIFIMAALIAFALVLFA